MGQTLSEPVTEKHTTVLTRDKKYWVGLSDMQGWRISMEDSHSVHLDLPPSENSAPSGKDIEDIPDQPAGSTVTNYEAEKDGCALFGVFDGHGGQSAAKFAGTTLHSRLSGLSAYKSGSYQDALKEAFLQTDVDLKADPSFFNDPSGCTAVVSLITNTGEIICANAGDSRCVLGYKGEAKAMSSDHKPTNKEETARITAAGGFVEFGRVNGNLALSRAIGDFEFKQSFALGPEKQIVSVVPDFVTHKVDGEEEFLVLACDGIWDCLSSQQVVDFTRRAIANGDALGTICENMMIKCLARDSETGGIGCDNMTVVIVALLGGRTVQEWRDWVRDRVEKKVGRETPESIPDVFAQVANQASLGGMGGGAGSFRIGGAGGLANIANILGASGITFKPMDDDSDDEEDEDMNDGAQKGSESWSEDTNEPESTSSKGKGKETLIDGYMDDKALRGDLKPQDVTDELPTKLVSSPSKRGSVQLVDADGDSNMDSDDESDITTTDTPNHSSTEAHPVPGAGNSQSHEPSFTSIGSPEVPTPQALQSQQKQLRSDPGGDAVPAVSKVEGLMDTSENPMKL